MTIGTLCPVPPPSYLIKDLYEASGERMPWDAGEKRRELFHSTSRMLMVSEGRDEAISSSSKRSDDDESTVGLGDSNKAGGLAAMAHFRFELDDEGPSMRPRNKENPAPSFTAEPMRPPPPLLLLSEHSLTGNTPK